MPPANHRFSFLATFAVVFITATIIGGASAANTIRHAESDAIFFAHPSAFAASDCQEKACPQAGHSLANAVDETSEQKNTNPHPRRSRTMAEIWEDINEAALAAEKGLPPPTTRADHTDNSPAAKTRHARAANRFSLLRSKRDRSAEDGAAYEKAVEERERVYNEEN